MRNKLAVTTIRLARNLQAEASFCDFAHAAAQIWSFTAVPHASGADNSRGKQSVLALNAFVLLGKAHLFFLSGCTCEVSSRTAHDTCRRATGRTSSYVSSKN